MYFLPELRGHGFAKKILEQCFSSLLKLIDFKACYLETTQPLFGKR